jgi:hypothetical protein
MIENQGTSLLKAVKAGDMQGVFTLLSDGANVDISDINGTTA